MDKTKTITENPNAADYAGRTWTVPAAPKAKLPGDYGYEFWLARLDQPSFMELVYGLELDNGTAVYGAVLFTYSVHIGLEADQVAWLDAKGARFDFAALKLADQAWLLKELEKAANRHATTYFEDAYEHFERT